MGYMIATSGCFCCKRLFAYNPDTVPSVRVNAQGQADPNGEREPICRACVEKANVIRKERGMQPINIRPDAYEPQQCD